jgi:membrane protein implicated in regulation of membrane protease activity
MSNATFWWLLAGAMVALELFTGTFYLLMLTVGLAAAAVAAHAGLGMTGQLLLGAVVGSAAVIGWHVKKKRMASAQAHQDEPEVRMDVGEVVNIDLWLPDGTARVQYRGAKWDAIHRPGVIPTPGQHRVAELVGNRLLVDKI